MPPLRTSRSPLESNGPHWQLHYWVWRYLRQALRGVLSSKGNLVGTDSAVPSAAALIFSSSSIIQSVNDLQRRDKDRGLRNPRAAREGPYGRGLPRARHESQT